MADALYWSQRLRRYGHTGWSDAATYGYDQRLRLRAIERVVLTPPHTLRRALDFGCGVGDFCALLAAQVEQVVGTDLSSDILARARERNARPNIRYTERLDEVLATPLDLILSVTVLQHIVDDAELARLLQRFAAALAPHGRIVVMETLADSERAGDHVKRRTLVQLVGLFARAGLALVEQYDFYHPSEAPTPAFLRYRRRPLVRVLARLAGWRIAPAARLLRRIARRAADADTAYLDGPVSPTKILVFSRAGATA